MARPRFLGLPAVLLTALLSVLGGCTTIVDATTSEPIQLNPGKRSLGMRIDDSQIETIASVNINKTHQRLDDSPIDVHSYNAVVLLVGQVPNAELRSLAGKTVDAIHSVRQVHNELEVDAPISFMTRSHDNWLTTKVKTKLYASRDVEGGRVKVITENASVYLMGLVSRAEADRITDIVSRTGGVERVVRVFEYID
ncbi:MULTISPECIES: BON domain-containing protein [unclassified Marinimicrobium]|jgi:osmotically-inducible protein OsmY|uniref:BON domain-containing protein n=1 Tax=unclassified Marinimicrobium TaxID=2632100 RepID=UPI000C5959AA|nr:MULTISPECIES: BON domain-containing protein [unclassified Marinimicrobium]MAN50965.1 phospholipid-binding protein [Marinimicrobium sp.]